MLLLVLADRHMRRAVSQDVGRHEHRIVIEPDRGVLAILAGLLLELGHTVEPAEPRNAIEHPRELRVFGNLALIEHDVPLGIDASGDESRRHLAGRAPKRFWPAPYVNRYGDRVHVDNAIDALELLLQRDEFLDRAEVVAEMQVAGRLHPGKHALLEHEALRWRR